MAESPLEAAHELRRWLWNEVDAGDVAVEVHAKRADKICECLEKLVGGLDRLTAINQGRA